MEEVLKKCEIVSASSARLDGGAAGEAKNKVLRSVRVEEKEEKAEEEVAVVGLLKAPVGNKKIKPDEAKRRGEIRGHRNKWTVESEA